MTDVRPNIFPAVRFADADAGVAFLKDAFGATERAVHRGEDGVIHHAELALGAGVVMVGQHSRELEDTDYGSREYSVRDPEGNLWSFGTYDPYDVP
jgi:uncharacterized glyoxalase superfamily protein PhnB